MAFDLCVEIHVEGYEADDVEDEVGGVVFEAEGFTRGGFLRHEVDEGLGFVEDGGNEGEKMGGLEAREDALSETFPFIALVGRTLLVYERMVGGLLEREIILHQWLQEIGLRLREPVSGYWGAWACSSRTVSMVWSPAQRLRCRK